MAQAARSEAVHRCIASGRRAGGEALIRFVVGPDGRIVPDLAERLPGRGLWLGAERRLLDLACAHGAFARAAKQPVQVDPALGDLVARQLGARALNLIGLARRAGEAVAGHEKVRRMLRAGRCGVLVQAADGAPESVARMRALAGDAPHVTLFTAAELGQALGRGRVVHAALAEGRLAERLLRETRRLAGFQVAPATQAARRAAIES